MEAFLYSRENPGILAKAPNRSNRERSRLRFARATPVTPKFKNNPFCVSLSHFPDDANAISRVVVGPRLGGPVGRARGRPELECELTPGSSPKTWTDTGLIRLVFWLSF